MSPSHRARVCLCPSERLTAIHLPSTTPTPSAPTETHAPTSALATVHIYASERHWHAWRHKPYSVNWSTAFHESKPLDPQRGPPIAHFVGLHNFPSSSTNGRPHEVEARAV